MLALLINNAALVSHVEQSGSATRTQASWTWLSDWTTATFIFQILLQCELSWVKMNVFSFCLLLSTWSSPGKLEKWYEEETKCLEGLIWRESHKGQGSRRKNSHRPEVLGPLLLSASFVTLSAFLWAPDSLRAQWEPSPGRALCCLATLKPSGYTQMQRRPSLLPTCPLLRVGTGGKEEWQAHQERITEGNE